MFKALAQCSTRLQNWIFTYLKKKKGTPQVPFVFIFKHENVSTALKQVHNWTLKDLHSDSGTNFSDVAVIVLILSEASGHVNEKPADSDMSVKVQAF